MTPLSVHVVYADAVFWSMGEGKGTPSFLRTIEGLVERGHEVHVSLPDRVDGSRTPAASNPSASVGASLHRGSPPGRIRPRASLPLVRRVWERWRCWRRYQRWAVRHAVTVTRQHRPDLVLALGAFEAPAARALARAHRVPNVSRFFGTWAQLDRRLQYWANFPEIAAFRTPAEAFVLTNDGSPGDRVAAREGVPAEKVFFLRNGVDFGRFSPGPPSDAVRQRIGVEDGQPLLMTVSRLSAEKKLNRAIELFAQVHREIPSALLAIVGEGDERPALEREVRALGLEGSVRFPGAIAQHELPDWYRTAELVLSLLDRTNTANPCFEAMASGAVFVALETGTTEEFIEDGENGIVLPNCRWGEAAPRLVELLRCPQKRAELGQAAAAHARRHLVSPSERLAFELDLYEAIGRGEAWPEARVP